MIAVPGLITSALGLLLLVPPVRRLVRRSVSRSVRRRAEAAGGVFTVTSTTVAGTVVREDEVPPPRGELLQANAIRELMEPLGLRFAGPALGGLVIAVFGVGTAFVVDAATFAASAVAVSLMTRQPPAAYRGAHDRHAYGYWPRTL